MPLKNNDYVSLQLLNTQYSKKGCVEDVNVISDIANGMIYILALVRDIDFAF